MTNNMINANVASYIAYLINHKDVQEISMNRFDANDMISWAEQRAVWALTMIRLAEFGIELPNTDQARKDYASSTESEITFAEAVTRTFDEHIEAEAA